MEKKKFIENLRAELLRRGYDRATVDAEMIPVKSYFEENGVEDVTVTVSEMADEIAEMIASPAKPEKAAEELSAGDEIESALRATEIEEEEAGKKDSAQAGKSDEKSAGDAAGVTDSAEAKGGEDNPESTEIEAAAGTETALTGDSAETGVEASDANEHDGDSDMKIALTNPIPEEALGEQIDDFDPDEYSPESDSEKVRLPEFIKKFLTGLKRGKKQPTAVDDPDFSPEIEDNYQDGRSRALFWAILIVCIPFLAFLAIVCVAIYLLFWLVLALLMIFIIAGLIAFVAAGAAVSIIGIVYGVIQVIKGLTPVGLFEIGLGIVVAACTAFIGILIYNVAVRLIPFAMKMLAKLLGLVFRRTKEGFAAVRRTLNEA